MIRDLFAETTPHHAFRPARSARAYGYRDGRPIGQDGAPSGYLLPWTVLDDEAEATVQRRPSQFVVLGEWVVDGIRYPELAVSDAYMKWAGYARDGRKWSKEMP